jgi:hypothetical protein
MSISNFFIFFGSIICILVSWLFLRQAKSNKFAWYRKSAIVMFAAGTLMLGLLAGKLISIKQAKFDDWNIRALSSSIVAIANMSSSSTCNAQKTALAYYKSNIKDYKFREGLLAHEAVKYANELKCTQSDEQT